MNDRLILEKMFKGVIGAMILDIDDVEQNFESGTAAVESLDTTAVYNLWKIDTKDGKIRFSVNDRTEEIARQNKEWMDEEKQRTGVEPSYF